MLNSLPVSSEHIRQWTRKDPVLSEVKITVQQVGRIPKKQTSPPTKGVKMNLVFMMAASFGELELLCHSLVVLGLPMNYMRDTLESPI